MYTFQESLLQLPYAILGYWPQTSKSQDLYCSCELVVHLILKVYLCTIFLFVLTLASNSKRLQNAKKVIEIVVCNLTLLLLSPFLITIISVVILIRIVINFVLRIVSGGRIFLVKNTDAFWSCDSVGNTNYLYTFGIFEQIDYNKDLFESKVNRMLEISTMIGSDSFAKLKYKIIKRWGFFCWEKSTSGSFNIKDHIEYLDTKDPFKVANKEMVVKKIETIFNTPMPDDHPKWKFYFIPNFKEESSKHMGGAFVWRIHHSYMDGLMVSNCCNWLLFDYPSKTAVDYFKEWDIKWYQRILINLTLIIFGPHNLLKSLLIKESHCYHGPPAGNSKTLGISRPINMNKIKAIKNVTNSSITAVLVTAIGGGLRSHALKNGYEVPAVIASSVSAAMLPYEKLEATNRFTVAHMPIEIGHENIGDRLKSAIQSAKTLYGNVQFLMNYQIVRLMGLFPAAIIEMFINNTHTTLVLSNIPGYTEPVQVDGHVLKELVCWNIIKGYIGLGVCIYSYADRICTGFVGDSAIFHDREDLEALIHEYENEMLELAKYAGVSTADLFLN